VVWEEQPRIEVVGVQWAASQGLTRRNPPKRAPAGPSPSTEN